MQKSRFSICKISSIKMNTIRIGMAVGVCFLLALAAGCSSDADLPPYPDGSNGDAGMNQPSEKDDEITTVPFTITLGGLSGSDGNAGQGGGNTRVALLVQDPLPRRAQQARTKVMPRPTKSMP